jgi:hypothetical protein
MIYRAVVYTQVIYNKIHFLYISTLYLLRYNSIFMIDHDIIIMSSTNIGTS